MRHLGGWLLASALGAALACGGRARSDDDATPARPEVSDPEESVPDLPVSEAPVSGGTGNGNPDSAPDLSIDPPTEPPEPPNQPTQPASQITDTLFWGYCLACHAAPPAGFEPNRFQFGDDVDVIVRLGLIVPLDSAGSRIVQVIQDGSMPPPGVTPRPSPGELQALIEFIDNPRFWTSQGPPPEPAFDAGPPALPADAGTSD